MNISSIGSNNNYGTFNNSINNTQKNSLKNDVDNGDRAIAALKKEIEDKKDSITELMNDDTLSDDYKKTKKKMIEDQIKDIEKQITDLQLQEQQRAMEETAQKNLNKNKKEKSEEEKNAETIIYNDDKIKSAAEFKPIKAEAQRDLTRENIYAQNDAANGYISEDRISYIGKLKKAINGAQNIMNEKYSATNNRIKEDSEESKEDKTDIDEIVKNKLEENKEDKIKNHDDENDDKDLKGNTIKGDVIKKYTASAFENYKNDKENDEKTIYIDL